ncbi:MAG: polysaccharide pyruvyl transferase family protein, partial [Aeromonadaceae bacterium]
MKVKIFYAGHNNFGNRGCEALVRSVSGLIRENYPNCEFITPSVNIDLDARQWPDAKSKSGIQFIEAARFPSKLKWWNRVRRFVPAVEKVGRPSYSLPSHIRDAIQASHAVVMTGGDTISLDYDLPSLYDHAGYIDEAKRQGKKAFLWGASVGPFSRLPHVEKLMKSHLSQYDAITVRESETFRYLSALG